MMRTFYFRLIPVLSFSISLLLSCQARVKKNKALPGYDINNPQKFVMPESLLEISGISFYNGNNDTVYAIQDEDGKVFRLKWGVKKSYPTKFAKKNDYEDLAILKENIYVLRSDGTLFSFPKKLSDSEDISPVKEWKKILPPSEYEGIYGEEATGKLYVLCKKCKADDNMKKLTGYIIDTKDSLVLSSTFSIDVTAIKGQAKRMNAGFRPSALALHPVTGEWYILSGSNKLLVVTDRAWQVKQVIPLDGNLFNQAEGIAFDANGNLYISNEGEEETNGNILLFERK